METDQQFDVDVYRGSTLLSSITVTAKDRDEASSKAFEVFCKGIKAKIKKHYG